MSEDEAGPSTHPRPTVAELELCGMKPRNRDPARIGNIARPIANFDPKHEVKYSAGSVKSRLSKGSTTFTVGSSTVSLNLVTGLAR